MHKEDVSNTACAFIAGATVGASIALLFAPQAGPELRSSVRDFTRRAQDEWAHASERGESALDTIFQRGKEWVQNAMRKQATGSAEDMQSTEAAMGAAQPRGTARHTGQDK